MAPLVVFQLNSQLEAAVRLDPKDAVAPNNLGISLVHTGDLQRARKVFVRALRLDPEHAQAKNNLQQVEYDLDGAVRAPRGNAGHDPRRGARP